MVPAPPSRHAMVATTTPALMPLLFLLIVTMASVTGGGGGGRARLRGTAPNDVLVSDGGAASSSSAKDDAIVPLAAESPPHNGCYSCVYRGFMFPDKECVIDETCNDMTCYKITAFVQGAPTEAGPWVLHGCAQPSAIDIIRHSKAECDVLSRVAEKLDPKGAPAHGTTFNRCAIHTCDNYDNDLPKHACNDGRLGPLWCWQYAAEIDDDIIKNSTKDFYSESDYFRATQNWLQNQRNATKCSEQGLDSCLSLSGWFRDRRWSVQTCADTRAVEEMLKRDESCAYLQDTLSNGKMGRHIIRFSQNSAPSSPVVGGGSFPSSCIARTCDTNGCNAQVPFFHLHRASSSSSSTNAQITSRPDPTSSPAFVTTGGGGGASPTPTDVTRLSSSTVDRDLTTTTTPSAAAAFHPTRLTWKSFSLLILNSSLLRACICVSMSFSFLPVFPPIQIVRL